MEGISRRSPEGDRKALWKYGNVQFDRKINWGRLKNQTIFLCCRENRLCETTKGLSDRPLETCGAATFGVIRG